VTHQDDQRIIFHSNFAQIYLPVSIICFVFIFTSKFYDDVMIT
jgi:hypothetical protein